MKLYRIKKSDIDKKGKGLYATRDIKEGEKITTYHPIQYIRTSDTDNSKIGSSMPTDGQLVASASPTPLGNIDVYNIYENIFPEKLTFEPCVKCPP